MSSTIEALEWGGRGERGEREERELIPVFGLVSASLRSKSRSRSSRGFFPRGMELRVRHILGLRSSTSASGTVSCSFNPGVDSRERRADFVSSSRLSDLPYSENTWERETRRFSSFPLSFHLLTRFSPFNRPRRSSRTLWIDRDRSLPHSRRKLLRPLAFESVPHRQPSRVHQDHGGSRLHQEDGRRAQGLPVDGSELVDVPLESRRERNSR